MKASQNEISIFKEIEDQNSAIADAFNKIRTRSNLVEAQLVHCHKEFNDSYEGPQTEGSCSNWASWGSHNYHYDHPYGSTEGSHNHGASWDSPSCCIVLILTIAGLVAFGWVLGPPIIKFILYNWQQIVLPTGGILLGAGMVLLISRVGARPLATISPPDADAENPLQELTGLADRSALRLRAAYKIQLWIVIVVGIVFISLIVWSMVMVSQQQILYASAFGSGGIAMAILTQWKWQPFDRINQARRLADNADIMSTGLRLRIKAIAEIQNPEKRAEAQWKAVSEYLDLS
jgi:hypothetical protein